MHGRWELGVWLKEATGSVPRSRPREHGSPSMAQSHLQSRSHSGKLYMTDTFIEIASPSHPWLTVIQHICMAHLTVTQARAVCLTCLLVTLYPTVYMAHLRYTALESVFIPHLNCTQQLHPHLDVTQQEMVCVANQPVAPTPDRV